MATAPAEAIAQQRDAFVDRLLQSVGGVWDIFTIHIGDRLGLYRALAELGSSTSAELAAHTNTHERYVREWLEQQATVGILEVESLGTRPSDRRFRLPAGHVEVLTDQESLNYLAPLAQIAVGVVHPIGAVLEAFKHGGGVPYHDYGVDLREGQAGMNRNMFLYELGPGVDTDSARPA